MAQPTAYDRVTNFQNQQAAAPSDPYPAEDFDAEYNAIKITLDEILQNIELIQRDDGALANGSVGRDQLDESIDLGFGAPSVWETATAYIDGFDTVFEGTGFYRCIVSHTSGVFATDLAAAKWELIADFSQATQDAIDAADDAAASATAAAASATSASSSASSASTSASSASTSASSASTSASSASTSASSASTSASSASSSASSASSSASSASTSASSAATSATAAAAAVGLRWTFDSSTTMADPGTGDVRLNHAALSSVTAAALSASSAETGNPDVSDFVASWDDGGASAHRGILMLRKVSAPENFVVFAVTGSVTDNSTWLQIALTYLTHSGSFSAADALTAAFTRTGASGAGDLSSVNNLSDVASAATSRTNLGLGTGNSPEFTAVNVGHASDTTITRASAGVIAVEGASVATLSTAQTWSAVQGYAESALTYSSGGTTAWDVSAKPMGTVAMSGGNSTMGAPSNVTAGRVYVLRVTQDSSVRTLAWNSKYHWVNGQTNVPVISSGSGAVDTFVFIGRASDVLEEIGRAQAVA